MGDLLNLLSGGLGGSLVGAVGAAFSKWADGRQQLKLEQLRLERDRLLNDHELKMAESNNSAAIAQMEYASLNTSLEMDRASYSNGNGNWAMITVDFIRGLVRPAITATLLIYSMIMLVYLTKHYNVQFSDVQVYTLVHTIVDNLVVCSGIALAWWFGSRNCSKVGSK